MMKSFPFEMMLNGLFMSSNFYASYIICTMATTPLPFLWMSNIYTFDFFLATAATSFQYLLLMTGAEMGNKIGIKRNAEGSMEKMENGVNGFFLGLIGSTLP